MLRLAIQGHDPVQKAPPHQDNPPKQDTATTRLLEWFHVTRSSWTCMLYHTWPGLTRPMDRLRLFAAEHWIIVKRFGSQPTHGLACSLSV